MGKKKPFIGSNEGQKFMLIHRSQKDPLIANNEVGDRVFAPISKKKTDEAKYGIYVEDDYDYLQHLKDRNEISGDVLDCSLVQVPEAKIKLPSTIFETRGAQLKVGMFNKAAPNPTLDLDADPEIIAALDGEFDDAEELEDDFMALANGGEGPIATDEQISVFRDEKSGRKEIMARFGLVREQFSDEDSDYELEEQDDFEHEVNDQPRGRRPKIVELMTSGSISSSVMPRNEAKRQMDACFDEIMEDYEDGKIGYGDDESEEDEEEEEGEDNFDPQKCREELDKMVKDVRYPFDQIENPSEEIKKKTLIAASLVDERTEVEQVAVEGSRKRNRWDAESILSTYSNLYNHPTVIREPSKKKRGITKKDLNALDSMDVDKVSVISGASVSTFRPPGETAEERRMRKQGVKEQQRERRAEKKMNKLAFKEEKRKMDTQVARQPVKGKPIK